MSSLPQWTWVWTTLGDSGGQGSLACCRPWSCRVRHNWVTEQRHMWPHFFLSCLCAKSFSHVQLLVTLWTVARQAPLSMGFSQQEYWSGLPRPLPGDLTDPGSKLGSLLSPSLSCGFFPTAATWEALKQREVKAAWSCPALCDPVDYTVRGILEAKTLGWGGELAPSPGDCPNPGIEPKSSLQADSSLPDCLP